MKGAYERGQAQGSSTSTPVTVSVSSFSPTANSYVLVAVDINSATHEVTSITGGTGTFVRGVKLVGTDNATYTLELWVGYNFGTSLPTNITINRTAGASIRMNATCRTIDIYADTTQAPSFTASAGNIQGVTGNLTADSNTLTPAAGDILFAGVAAQGTSPSNTRTHTGNSYTYNKSVITGAPWLESCWCEAVSAVSSKEVWNLSATNYWVAVQVMWTPPDVSGSPSAAWVAKGRDSAADDTESAP